MDTNNIHHTTTTTSVPETTSKAVTSTAAIHDQKLVRFCGEVFVVGDAKQVISLVEAMKSIFFFESVRRESSIFRSMHMSVLQLTFCVFPTFLC
ncbi:hypothetical protein YC2023_099677 [Brassica napus]